MNSWKQVLSLSVMTVACRKIISSAVGDRQSWAAASARVADAILCTRWQSPFARLVLWISTRRLTNGRLDRGHATRSTRRPGWSTSNTGCQAWRAGACGSSPNSGRPSHGLRRRCTSTSPRSVPSSRIRASTSTSERKFSQSAAGQRRRLIHLTLAGDVCGRASHSPMRLRRWREQ